MDLQEIKDRMHSGRLYCCHDETLIARQERALDLQFEFNQLRPSQKEERQKLLKQMFADLGEGCYVNTPFHACWGGQHVHFGNHVYSNVNLTLVDDTHIYVDDDVMFGPNVTLCTATHPINPQLRRKKVQYNKPIHICRNVWIGGGVFVMPGVTIGENSVIGANSVVTKDVPANVIAVGNPCRVLRPIDRRDDAFYDKDKPLEQL